MNLNYAYGKRKELQVAEFLERRGFKWVRAHCSRGAADLIVQRGSARFVIQVKATRTDIITTNRITKTERRRLQCVAAARRALPVYALVSRNYVWFVSTADHAILLQGELKTSKYKYHDER